MKFIVLTIWDATRIEPQSQHGKPIWISPEKIISMNVHELTYLRSKEDYKIPINERPRESTTYIHFGAGHEDSDGIYVCETPAQIIGHIGYGGIS